LLQYLKDYLNYIKEILSIPVIVSLIVSLPTLAVSLYVSYKLAIRREMRLRTIESHSKALRDLARRWLQGIPSVFPAKTPKTSEQPLEKILIEKEHLFSDLKNHIPPDLKLLEIWEKFKKDLGEYEKKRFSLFQEILEDCKERTKLPYNPDFKKGYGFSTHFITHIYSDIFSGVEGYEPDSPSARTKIEKEGKELWTLSGYGLVQGSKEEIEKAKKVWEEFLQKSKFISKAKGLLKDQESLQETNNELRRCINDFISIPLYRGECKYIKRSV